MGVGAVVEAAVGRYGKYVAKVVRHLVALDVESAKALYPWNVDERTPVGQFKQLAVSGGVHARAVGVRYLCRAHMGVGNKQVEQCRLAHPRVAGQQRGAPLQRLAQRFNALGVEGRHAVTLVANVGVQRLPVVHHLALGRAEVVLLVKGNAHRHAVSLGRGQKAVDKGSARFGPCNGHHEQGHVHVGGQNVALFRQVRSLANDVVASLVNFGDKGCRLLAALGGLLLDGHPIAHGYGVGRAYAAQAEVAFHLTFNGTPVVGAHQVPAACAFDYFSVHEVWGNKQLRV